MKPQLIPVNEPFVGDQEKEYVLEALQSGWISSSGKYVKAFEEKFAQFCDVKYATTTTNGTTAIHLALKCLDLQPGDEVLVPSFTMVGSVYPIIQCGAIPVFVDSQLDTFNLDVKDLEKKVTAKTKAILVVHLYGHPADMDEILALAKKHHLYVIEDAAEAHGALYKNKKVGGLGHIGCFSFYANKIITTGEGGMLVTQSEEIIAKARRLKDLAHGEVRFTHDLPEAYNYRMTNLQAAIGLAQLERAEQIISKKINDAKQYTQLLANISDLILPVCQPWVRNVYWMYAVRVKPDSKYTKDQLMHLLKEAGVETRSFFYPLYQQKAFKQYNKHDCPNAKVLSETGFYLPSGQALTPQQITHVANALNALFESELMNG